MSLLLLLFLFQLVYSEEFYINIGTGIECLGTQNLHEYGYPNSQIDYDAQQLTEQFPEGWAEDDPHDPSIKYRFMVCARLLEMKCGTDDNTWCLEEITQNDECIKGLSNWEESEKTLIEYYAIFNDSDIMNAEREGIYIEVLDQGQYHINCTNQHSTLNYRLNCDPTTPAEVVSIESNITNCLWNITFKSQWGCFDIVPSVSTTSSPSSGSSTQILSGGSVFLIILIVLFLTYLILGCAYNSFYHGRVGMDALPNKETWTQFGRYTRAGCETSRDTVCCSSGSGAYQEL